MLRQTLQAVVRAAQRSIETTCDWAIRNVAVHPVDDARVNVRLCTMLTAHAGPIKRILFCCEESLADHVADRIQLPDDDYDTRTTAAFRMLASVFDQSLATDNDWYRSAGEFCQFGPGAIRAEFHGSKSFRIKLPTPAGPIELLVQLAGAASGTRRSGRGVGPTRNEKARSR